MPSKSIDHAFTAGAMRGAASDPTYAGALSFMRRRFTKSLKGADAVVWGIPFDAAVSNRPGARFGPQAIRRASAIFDNDPQYPFGRDLFEDMAVIDYGDCLLDYGNHQKTPATIEREAGNILKSGAFLLTLGGDHFVTWPLLKAHAAVHGPLSLVQFDAHQDTWFDDGKRIDHGSFVARAVRDGIIDPDTSIQIGIRTHAPEDFGIQIIHGHELEDMRSGDVASRIIARTGGRPVYLTFDIDCLDPAFAPGTGTPVAGGPTSAKILSILRQLRRLDIRGADVVEVAPAYDHADVTAIAGATVAMYTLGLLAERRASEPASGT
ncbi:agmatinase [Pararhizobium haloflavum]|uniref:agmatinase n=1 Tax=Pararhizobium haloflavum TaxID=2037914 RepID=UPI000C181421|nr:agmatinase [Pararhizobium haloflavum]